MEPTPSGRAHAGFRTRFMPSHRPALSTTTHLKFFTPEWHGGETPDDQAIRVPAAYDAHVRGLVPPLPDEALRLVYRTTLHDGLIRQVTFAHRVIEVVIRAGDNRAGYFDARLRYGNGEASEEDRRFFESVAGRRDVEILYDEFDSIDNAWIHRILFWPYHEVSVRFATLSLDIAPVTSRFDDWTG